MSPVERDLFSVNYSNLLDWMYKQKCKGVWLGLWKKSKINIQRYGTDFVLTSYAVQQADIRELCPRSKITLWTREKNEQEAEKTRVTQNDVLRSFWGAHYNTGYTDDTKGSPGAPISGWCKGPRTRLHGAQYWGGPHSPSAILHAESSAVLTSPPWKPLATFGKARSRTVPGSPAGALLLVTSCRSSR